MYCRCFGLAKGFVYLLNNSHLPNMTFQSVRVRMWARFKELNMLGGTGRTRCQGHLV
ncbi:hypothetical protein AG1IA_08257 [Rhizoctonia solani AG-1 IA]|uniref:Uncharacterized protein n=1 Tax=Thanatephorus cucumeris (strain AG1-IA) TaxID=983506 RepID=L8WII9_THACA|nr:hypothetical protein AG1IA_08257 [Rhizoctonia solani AG-1 IA]